MRLVQRANDEKRLGESVEHIRIDRLGPLHISLTFPLSLFLSSSYPSKLAA